MRYRKGKKIGWFRIFPFVLIAKLIFVRYVMFGDRNLLHGLLLEGPPVVVGLLAAGIIYRGWVRRKSSGFSNEVNGFRFYMMLDLMLSFFLLAVLLYFEQFGRLITYHSLGQLNMLGEIRGSIIALLKPLHFFLFMDFVMIFIHRLKNVTYPWTRVLGSNALLGHKLSGFLLLCLVLLSITVFMNKQYLKNPTKLANQAGILNAEVLNIMGSNRFLSFSSTVVTGGVSAEELNALKKSRLIISPRLFGAAKGKNLIVVQFESVQTFAIGLKLNGREITPNLNKLAQESLYFPNFFTQIGQGVTSDAEFVSNTSVYPLAEGAIARLFQEKSFPGLPKMLEPVGYKSYTFHTNTVHFWSRHEMYPALGYTKYFDQEFFGKEGAFGYGASDEVLFSKSMPVLKQLAQDKEPFYANFVTVSSHHPFEMPGKLMNDDLPSDFKGTGVGRYLHSLRYADYALGKFISDLKQEGLWEQSLVVVYGDHFGLTLNLEKADQELMAKILKHNYDEIDYLNVPLFIRIPGVQSGTVRFTGGEIDLLPTIVNLLGLSLTIGSILEKTC